MKRVFRFVLLFFFLLNAFLWTEVFRLSRAAPLEVTFFDVGEGDAVLIKASPWTRILVDGGPGKKILEKLPRNLFLGGGFDSVVLTHPDRDHMEGLISVLRKRKVENVYWTGVEKETRLYSSWKKELKKKNQETAVKGRELRAGEVRIETLHPGRSLAGERVEEANETSVVLKLGLGKTNFLLTGDLPAKQERRIGEGGVEILKVAHHGSKTSSSRFFLKRVAPKVAVIQTGGREFGHPDKEVLTRLEETGARVLRTDKEGKIEVLSDGRGLVIRE